MEKNNEQKIITFTGLLYIVIITMIKALKYYIGLFLYQFHLRKIIKKSDWGRK
tara:strand:+ start:873 stop:1031 length:159 start_codon:yes stop_codon:yes gene_type:complete